jgi:hypothetical protein
MDTGGEATLQLTKQLPKRRKRIRINLLEEAVGVDVGMDTGGEATLQLTKQLPKRRKRIRIILLEAIVLVLGMDKEEATQLTRCGLLIVLIGLLPCVRLCLQLCRSILLAWKMVASQQTSELK